MEKVNQRVAISKRLLKDGILRLLKKKNINEISVCELCAEAEINRTTFYRHYQTPHDVLLEIEFDFVSAFYNVPVALKDGRNAQKNALYICNFLYDNREIVKIFLENSSDGDVARIVQNLADNFFASGEVLYKGKAMDMDTRKLMITFFASGVYSLVRQWIMEDIPKSPEEIAELMGGSFSRDFSFL